MRKIISCLALIFLVIFDSNAQTNSREFCVTTYFQIIGRTPSEQEILGCTQGSSSTEVVNSLQTYIKDHESLQRDIIRYAYIDAYGNPPSQSELENYYITSKGSSKGYRNYTDMMIDLKVYLRTTPLPLQGDIIKHSYLDAFGRDPNTTEYNSYFNSAINRKGLTYTEIITELKAFIFQIEGIQKQIINLAYQNVFNRNAESTELISYYNTCLLRKGSTYKELVDELTIWKRQHPTLPPYVPPTSPINCGNRIVTFTNDRDEVMYYFQIVVDKSVTDIGDECLAGSFITELSRGQTYTYTIPVNKVLLYRFYYKRDCLRNWLQFSGAINWCLANNTPIHIPR